MNHPAGLSSIVAGVEPFARGVAPRHKAEAVVLVAFAPGIADALGATKERLLRVVIPRAACSA
jgi:hypothetical protein